jgi:tetratricopeptide (TPR) repeat protein
MGNYMGNSKPERVGGSGTTREADRAEDKSDLNSLSEILRRIDHPAGESRLVLEQKPFEDRTAAASKLGPLDMAEELIGKARDASGSRRIEFAREALNVFEDCIDAYVILAEESARSLAAAKELYEQGVKAGERYLGPGAFENCSETSWSLPQTKAYMRARAGLAQCLWSLGQKQDAISHCAEMLRLNPADDQGVRYHLANWLLHEELYDDLGNLFEAYQGDSTAAWLYTRALWAFTQEGWAEKANSYLEEALRQNPFVPSYLLGLKKMPGILPEHVEAGDEREAISYIAEALNTWLKTEGALEWLIISLPKAL